MPVDINFRPFTKELDFEKALADLLPQHEELGGYYLQQQPRHQSSQ